MANTPIDICNKALDLLGQVSDVANITTPTTENEVVCARWYYDTLDFLLRRYVWNFAIKRVVVARDIKNSPPFEYSDAYKIPSDFVRLLAINGRDDFANMDFDESGGFIFMNNNNAPSINLKYISRIEDVRKFDSGFSQLLTLYLALNLTYKFTQKQTTIERLLGWIDKEEAKIISIDGQERPPRRIQRSKYGRARRRVESSWGTFRPVQRPVSEVLDNASS